MTSSKSVLVTGANGFVGTVLCNRLRDAGMRVVRAVRVKKGCSDETAEVEIGDIRFVENWNDVLADTEAVVHLAARTHGRDLDLTDEYHKYHQVNVEATKKLAAATVRVGVPKFVYLSSIKVNGEGGGPHSHLPYSPDDGPKPLDNYGRSKLAAETMLTSTFEKQGTALTILRPPLVYGPAAKGNLLSLMRLVELGVPLPFAGLRNQRSLIYVENLVDAIICSLNDSSPGARCYTVADLCVSTPELIAMMAGALGKSPRLFKIPNHVFRIAGKVPRLHGAIFRLTQSLAVDSSKIQQELGWKPAFEPVEGMTAFGEWFKSSR